MIGCGYPYCGGDCDCPRWKAIENPPMPQSNKEKQEAFRARNAMLGLTEVRGIFLPPARHAELKALAEQLRKKIEAGKVK